MKTLQALQTIAVDLARRGAALVAKFARRIFKRRLSVAKAIAAVEAGKLAVDKDGDAGFARAGADVVRRKDAGGRRRDNESLRFREERLCYK